MSTSAVSKQNAPTLYGTYANRPSSALIGAIYTCSDGGVQFVYTGSVWAPVLGGVVGVQPPAAASWTHYNFGSGTTLTDSQGALYLQDFTSGGNENDHAAAVNVAGATYTVTAAIRPLLTQLNNAAAGILITNGTQAIKFQVAFNNAAITTQVVLLNSFLNGFNSNAYTIGWAISSNARIWLRIQNNGTNRLYSYSVDGINWLLIFSHASTAFLSPNETQYGISVVPLNSAGAGITLESWATSTP